MSLTGIKNNETYHCTNASNTKITSLAAHHPRDKAAPCMGAVPLCAWHTAAFGFSYLNRRAIDTAITVPLLLLSLANKE